MYSYSSELGLVGSDSLEPHVHSSSQLHVQWHHVSSLKFGHGGSIYSIEIVKGYKSRL